jgi:hypothetical protein
MSQHGVDSALTEQQKEIEQLLTELKGFVSWISIKDLAVMIDREKRHTTNYKISSLVLLASISDRSPKPKTWASTVAYIKTESFKSGLATVDIDVVLNYGAAIRQEVRLLCMPKKSAPNQALHSIHSPVYTYERLLGILDSLTPTQLDQVRSNQLIFRLVLTINKLISKTRIGGYKYQALTLSRLA